MAQSIQGQHQGPAYAFTNTQPLNNANNTTNQWQSGGNVTNSSSTDEISFGLFPADGQSTYNPTVNADPVATQEPVSLESLSAEPQPGIPGTEQGRPELANTEPGSPEREAVLQQIQEENAEARKMIESNKNEVLEARLDDTHAQLEMLQGALANAEPGSAEHKELETKIEARQNKANALLTERYPELDAPAKAVEEKTDKDAKKNKKTDQSDKGTLEKAGGMTGKVVGAVSAGFSGAAAGAFAGFLAGGPVGSAIGFVVGGIAGMAAGATVGSKGGGWAGKQLDKLT